MQIIDLTPDNQTSLEQTAQILVAAFQNHWPTAWSNLGEAREEIEESFAEDRISRIALDEVGTVLGWIGGAQQYQGHVWELHPLAVRPDCQRQGVGRALVADLENQARRRGGVTLWLGSDDEDEMTSLSGVDLYSDPFGHIAAIRNFKGHPYEFYQKVGFTIIGVLPDANGPGKPDIYMAKSLIRQKGA